MLEFCPHGHTFGLDLLLVQPPGEWQMLCQQQFISPDFLRNSFNVQRRALYATLLSSEVAHTAKAPMFLALLFKVRMSSVESHLDDICSPIRQFTTICYVLRRQPYHTDTAVAAQAVRADVSGRRAAAFVKRLMQVAAMAPANFAAGSVFLISELLKVGGLIPSSGP